MSTSNFSAAAPFYVRGQVPPPLDAPSLALYLARELQKIEVATRMLSERLTTAGF